jgi:hypothetical protein
MRRWLSLNLVLLTLSAARSESADPPVRPVDFNRDIRPILADSCFACHGPDKNKRKAKLHFDTEDGAFADLGGHRAIVPGDPEKSELYQRITSVDENERMPPGRSGRKLSSGQIDLLRRWIAEGAKWQKHWSLIPPSRPVLPVVKMANWPRNGIDHFILDRLEREGLAPSPEAARTTLLRRVTLDLTGLPPTPAELDVFLADRAPDAYERAVDRLLASPRLGERLASRWLDAARYADTCGYQNDGERFMWRWRDWVIDAYNRNMPFDQFTVEQLAGDMLPSPTLEQRIATGFNRNHRGNAEGGIIPEEYAVEYVVDRVDTTFTVWQGLTIGCARCHEHKFDPIAQKEYYQLFAYFNNVPEHGRAVKFGNSPPYIMAPTPVQQEELHRLEVEIAHADKAYRDRSKELAAAQTDWEVNPGSRHPVQWFPTRELQVHLDLDGHLKNARNPDSRVEFVDGQPRWWEGPLGRAAALDGRRFLAINDVGDFGFYDKFTLAAWVYAEGSHGGTILSRMTDAAQADGYSLELVNGKLQANLVKRWLDDACRVETARPLSPDQWHHVALTYDGSRVASGVKLYVDGVPAEMKVLLDELNQSFATKEPFRIGGGGGKEGRFHGRIADVRVYSDRLEAEDVAMLATPETINVILIRPPEQRNPGQSLKLRACFLETAAPRAIVEARQKLLTLRRQREKLIESIPTTMVMEEMPKRRDTYVLQRGVYDKRGERVTPGIPTALGANTVHDRLGFARWLVGPANPLTARVAVNRFWQMYFGTGLVKTVDDFGTQGEWPSHPELLDWLAPEFVRLGWDTKALLRLIVTSATYRQSSKTTPALLQRDPENRLLARGCRQRLSAEMIRDQALAASGLLVEHLGGPSAKPYQPAGLWKELTGTEEYVPDHGPSLYRRSLYTFWKRTVAPPTMLTFDAAGRETCIVRQSVTNTPLQALTLLNEITFVEAARVLAQRVMRESPGPPTARLARAFRLVTGRLPSAAESEVLQEGYQRHLAEFRADPARAAKLVHIGEAPGDQRLDVAEWAALTTMAGLMLNLDETITKE